MRRRDFGQTKIKNLCVATTSDKNIPGLDIAMDNALGMCCVEGVGDLDRETEENVGLQRLAGDTMLQRYAIKILHGNKALAIMLSNLVNSANVGMIQCRGSPRFTAETFQSLRIFGDVVRQKLQCSEAAE